VTVLAEALEALGHPQGALPEPRLLADLFVRFQAQVPLRRSADGVAPEELLAAWLRDGEGCCGEARVRAFEALAAGAGFALGPGTAFDARGVSRSVLLAGDRRLLLDPGFPLPGPLALDPPAEQESTGYGTLAVRPSPGGAWDVHLETRGEVRLLFRVEPGARPGGGDVPARAAAGLFRLLEDRLLRWSGGVLEVSDSWSRLRVPLPATDADGLEAHFGPPIPGPTEAGTAAGAVAAPTLAVYHAAFEDASRLRGLLADPATHAALLPEGWVVDGLVRRRDGFDRTLVEGAAVLRRERVALLPDGFTVEADGPLALFRTRTLRIEPRPEGSRLRLLATLRDPVPPRGLPEGTRRRLVFELGSELLALDRHSTEE